MLVELQACLSQSSQIPTRASVTSQLAAEHDDGQSITVAKFRNRQLRMRLYKMRGRKTEKGKREKNSDSLNDLVNMAHIWDRFYDTTVGL